MTTGDEILAALGVAPEGVPSLPARVRTSLVKYLIRWQHYDSARRCLERLLATHNHLVSMHDNLARVLLAQGDTDRALKVVKRRAALKTSTVSEAVEAQVHLAAGNSPSAEAIVQKLRNEHPYMLRTWRLQTEVCLATGDLDSAAAALEQREILRPEAADTAKDLAQLWHARGDPDKALLWARTALARAERDSRTPSVELLSQLEDLYRATGQVSQAEAIAARQRRRQEQELEELRRALQPVSVPVEVPPAISAPGQRAEIAQDQVPVAFSSGVISGGVDLTPDERRRLEGALHCHFPHKDFRPGQADVIAAVLRGESVLAVMPTGSGKSLCYQLAALLLPGTTLVISPLIALMKDQLDGLPAGVIQRATTLNSSLDGVELHIRMGRAAQGRYKILYMAPERLRQRSMLHALARSGISLLVVDEAHCVSLWGHDFRPDYLFIAKAWRELGQPPILAMTATATPRVRDDIQAAFGRMRHLAIDVHRPNLRLEARRYSNNQSKKAALLRLCQELEGSGIVYATARHRCEELAGRLRKAGISAIHYHAGIDDRAAAQDRFMSGESRIVVATIAFGMGVDKSDVRFIIHFDPPKTLENYYQEAGRAGRDGAPARCILFHTAGDQGNLTRWCHQDALKVGFLRQVLAAIKRRLGNETAGLVPVADLERDLVSDSTRIRVAVHLLETAGLLWRGFDLPRTATLALRPSFPGDNADLARFVAAARLRPGLRVSRDLLAVSCAAGLDPRTVETQLLAWQDAGWLQYRGTGRDMFLALLTPPSDSRQRVAAMLADHRAGQDSRLAEMMEYAQTRSCRHAHISRYFGARPMERCTACDNCLGLAGAEPESRCAAQPIPPTVQIGDPSWTILRAVGQLPFPMGRTGLARALQGAPTSPVQADRFPSFGALARQTQKDIHHLIDQLEAQGLLEAYSARGYRLVRLSAEGRTWLEKHPGNPGSTAPSSDSGPRQLPECDQDLFEQLLAWRRQTPREIGKSPFVVLHAAVLRRIATSRPATLDELATVKGIGPHKLEQYGKAILAVIARDRT